MQDVVFATLLVIEDELDCDVGAAGPVGVGRVGAVTGQIAGVSHGTLHDGQTKQELTLDTNFSTMW
mgnify:CR=1 FL=1